MSIIAVNELFVSHSGDPLFDNANFLIEQGERVALLGRNGTGKTTFLRILEGTVSPDAGEVIVASGIKISALQQDVPKDIKGTCLELVLEAVSPQIEDENLKIAMAGKEISRVGLEPQMEVSSMSGGQKRRALLAKALVGEPDLLLLDEPTNHLDIESILKFEAILAKYQGAVLFVSHDREFIKKIATKIVSLEMGKLISFPGNYNKYLEMQKTLLNEKQRADLKQDKKLAEEEVWIRKGIQARRTRNEGRVRHLIKLRQEVRARREKIGKAEFSIEAGQRSDKTIVKFDSIGFSYDDTQAKLLKNFSATVFRGDKIGIIGPNGCGKTTLIKLILGELEPSCGTVFRGERLQIAYLDQLRETLDLESTVAKNLSADSDSVVVNGKPKHIYSYLQDFLFSPQRAKTPVWILSGGEKNRLLLAKLFANPANVLVMDEPTNDLDIETLELLEEKISLFAGTVIIVSHDRSFLNNTVSSTLAFELQDEKYKVTEYAGGYDDWVSQRSKQLVIVSEKKQKIVKKNERNQNQFRKLTYKENRELEELPQKIEELEAKQAECTLKLEDPDFFINNAKEVNSVTDEINQIEVQLFKALERWEYLEAIRDKKCN